MHSEIIKFWESPGDRVFILTKYLPDIYWQLMDGTIIAEHLSGCAVKYYWGDKRYCEAEFLKLIKMKAFA